MKTGSAPAFTGAAARYRSESSGDRADGRLCQDVEPLLGIVGPVRLCRAVMRPPDPSWQSLGDECPQIGCDDRQLAVARSHDPMPCRLRPASGPQAGLRKPAVKPAMIHADPVQLLDTLYAGKDSSHVEGHISSVQSIADESALGHRRWWC
jgi:hypothetical protein